MTLEIDFETASPVNLKTRGAYVYFEDPETRPLLCSYRIDGGPVRRWRPPASCPADIGVHVNGGGLISAHNAQFERLLWQQILTPRYGWPEVRTEQFRCTAATAAAMSLPRDLAGLGEALGLTVKKDKAGAKLIQKFSVRMEVPEGPDFEAFHDYCDTDVLTEAEADRRMVPLSSGEQALWVLDQKINDRGVRLDRKSALAALEVARRAKSGLDDAMIAATGGQASTTRVSAILDWATNQFAHLDSLGKADVEEFLTFDDVPEEVRHVLELRQAAAKTSVTKLRTMLNRASADGRVRGSFLFSAAGTGRWSSTGAQLHNLPRPRKEFADAHLDPATLFDAIRHGDPGWLKFAYGDTLGRPLWLLSDAIRGFLWAAPGHDLVVADYAGIEGAVAAWFAGEQWKLDALFELIADPSLPDLYRRTAAGIYGAEVGKKDPRRQVGKVAELSCIAENTLVLTRRGPVVIQEVLATDYLWDGCAWVRHGGLVLNGVRPTVAVDGIELTGDHLVLTGPTWKPAQELAFDDFATSQALARGSASLPYAGVTTGQQAVSSPSGLRVRVARQSTASAYTTFCADARHVARLARRKRRARRESATGATTTSWLMRAIGIDSSAASQPASTAATSQAIGATLTTADAGSASIGATTAERSWRTWSRYLAGISRRLSSTVLTSTATTLRAISGSSREQRTDVTNALSERCRTTSSNLRRVYDILNVGPINRFTVLSNSGALIVHNCQYQGGVGAFRTMARGYNLSLDKAYGPVWEAADHERRDRAEQRREECLGRGDDTAKQLSREAWLAAELVKVGWRATNPAIAASWKLLEEGVKDAVTSGEVVHVLKASFRVARGFLWCRLPSGRCLAYGKPAIRELEVPWADKTVEASKRERRPTVTVLGVNSQTRAWERYPLYGGLLFENIVQAIARDLLANGLQKAEEGGYPVIGHVHDEIITELPRGEGDVRAFEKLICELPAWAAGLPLTASGWRGKRYRKD